MIHFDCSRAVVLLTISTAPMLLAQTYDAEAADASAA
jgi:hypothetical protein